MNSVSDDLPKGKRRGPQAVQKLAGAYQSLFDGRGSLSDAHLVSVDLAEYTGWLQVANSNATGEQRAYCDGQRSVYARIFRFLRMTEQEIKELEEAARREAIVSSQEGMIE